MRLHIVFCDPTSAAMREEVRIFANDGDALSEVWRMLSPRVIDDVEDLTWTRSDGTTATLAELVQWAAH